jgi:hypothetical protein
MINVWLGGIVFTVHIAVKFYVIVIGAKKCHTVKYLRSPTILLDLK